MGRITLVFVLLAVITVSHSAAEPTDEDLAVLIQQEPSCSNFSKYLPKMALDNPADLPCSRPAPYKYERSLTMLVRNGTALVRPPRVPGKAFATARKDAASKAVIWTLKNLRLRNVTPAKVRWMWNNMDKQVADPRDGRKWQVFQLMHPSDHVSVTWNTKDLQVPLFPGDAPGNATKWVWTEIPASGCKVNSTNIECPANQPGFTCNSITAARLKKIATLNLSMVTSEMSSEIDDAGLEVAAITMRYFFNIKDAGCIQTDLWRPFFEFRHVMFYPKDAKSMRVEITWTVGWPSSLAVIFNEPYLQPLWAGFTGAGGVGGKNWRLAANYYIMHTLQEWSALPLWLPQVYDAEMAKQG